jgi:adenine phosphoribosyltransferase
MLVHDLRKALREVPDFPKPGILFYDVSTLFRNAEAFHSAVERMVDRFRGDRLDAVAGIEARGFVLASAMAYALGTGLVMIRKPGKLPSRVEREGYELEYGEGQLEVHADAVSSAQRVLVVDDLLATGGTAAATGRLLRRLGAQVEGYAFMVELGFLGGRKELGDASVFSLIQIQESGGL